jgi:hypothetical protein
VSTSFASRGLLVDEAKGERARGAMLSRIVGRALLPARPDQTAPGAGEDADGVGMLVPAIACALIDASRPRVGVTRGVGERGEGLAQEHVAGPAKRDRAVLAGLAGHGRGTALGRKMVGGHKASPVVAELDEYCAAQMRPLRNSGVTIFPSACASTTCSTAVLSVASRATSGRSTATSARTHSPLVSASSSPMTLLGADRRRSTSSAAVRRPQYACRAMNAPMRFSPRPAADCGVGAAVEELEGDRRIDVSEDLRSTRPELLEQAAQLVGGSDALADQVVAYADQTTQCLGLVGQRNVGFRNL